MQAYTDLTLSRLEKLQWTLPFIVLNETKVGHRGEIANDLLMYVSGHLSLKI